MEKLVICVGEVFCWEYFIQFWNINGGCICESCVIGFKVYGFGSVFFKNIFFVLKEVFVFCSFVLLGGIQGEIVGLI